MRTIVDIPDKTIRELAKICKRLSISRTEAVRRAVEIFIKQNKASDLTTDDVFGMWKHKTIDSRDYQNNIRNEWKSDHCNVGIKTWDAETD